MQKLNLTTVSILAIANNETRTAAFAKGINRDVNLANAKKITADIKKRGYRQAELIQVIPAEAAIANGDITLVDINGTPIPNEDAAKYYLVLDGQHRVFAVSMFNAEVEHNKIQIPAIIVELGEGETIAEYISAINVTKAEWKPTDYVRGAANVQQSEILNIYKSLVKSDDNPQGFPLSTLNLIYFGNAKELTKSDFSLLCQGKTEKGVKTPKKIIEGECIERGNRFIELCLKIGFTHKDIAKRYLIERFNKFLHSKGEDYAFKVFEAITPNDLKSLYNEHNSLEEGAVIRQLDIIKARIAG